MFPRSHNCPVAELGFELRVNIWLYPCVSVASDIMVASVKRFCGEDQAQVSGGGQNARMIRER